MTSTAEVVEEQEVARAESARLAVGCLEFELALAEHAELALRSGMEISEPVLGPAEEDDSGGGERIGDCDWRSGRRERGKFGGCRREDGAVAAPSSPLGVARLLGKAAVAGGELGCDGLLARTRRDHLGAKRDRV